MNRKEFWNLIDGSKEYEDQAEWLLDVLAQKSINEILDFEFHFQGFMNESYQSQLWAAAYILMGGCSDDTFDYFRGWLIGQGEEVYNKVMQNHEYLAKYISEENLDEEGLPQNEELLSVGADAYTLKKTGDIEWNSDVYDELLEELNRRGIGSAADDIDLDWEEDEEELEKLFPLLWKRFGEDSLG
ncbi:DUF4240 domain-containing protein [Pseudobacillus wudalianchiensis]|uniref:DUF4240 domain-containing protein n=1 Tax=Pseudobacillus wudalianchiensis TaxID=1743143 RepID=UPI0008087C39|nr:DUF4240 domain-containing protein [Bacillus wudalianchiensis]